jgi:hypothetical protein
MVCLLCLVLGCGAGSNAGGGGGGGGGSAPTSLTLSTSAVKAPFGSPVTFTATVNSSAPATGFINIFDVGRVNSIATIILMNNSGNTGSVQLGLGVGTHVITAQYTGDYGNLPSSTKGSINQVITGTVPVSIGGTEFAINHSISGSVTIQ